jgi:hypothetical protein
MGARVIKGVLHNKYARWEDIDRIIRPLYSEEGFMLSFDSEPGSKPGLTRWTIICAHIQGHKERRSVELIDDEGGSKNKLQEHLSSGSYAKRILGSMTFNLVGKDEDDDAEAASFLTDEQHNNVQNMVDECALNPMAMEKFLEFAGASSIDKIQQRDYERVMNMLRKKLQGVRDGKSNG